jgi:hypothetical protein
VLRDAAREVDSRVDRSVVRDEPLRDARAVRWMLVLALVSGCGGAPTSAAASRLARGLAPAGCTTTGTNAANLGNVATLPAALGLALAGAPAQPIPSCGPVTGMPPTSSPPGFAVALAPRPPTPDPTGPPADEEPGRYACTSADGDADLVVAETVENATTVCGELTGTACRCHER